MTGLIKIIVFSIFFLLNIVILWKIITKNAITYIFEGGQVDMAETTPPP